MFELGRVGIQQGHPRIFVWPQGAIGTPLELGPDVLSMQVSKSVASTTGTFSIAVLPRTEIGGRIVQTSEDYTRLSEYFRAIEPRSVISIGFEADGGIMLGIVKTRSESHDYTTGQRTLTISGTDLGIALKDPIVQPFIRAGKEADWRATIAAVLGDKHPIIDHTVLNGVETSREDTPNFLNRSIEDVIEYILKTTGTLQIPILRDALGGSGKIGDWMDTTFSITSWDRERVWGWNFWNFQGDIEGFVRQVIDPDFYEVRVDTVPPLPIDKNAQIGQPVLIIRPKPFDESPYRFAVDEAPGIDWIGCPTLLDRNALYHDLPQREAFNLEVSTSDSDAAYWYQVTSSKDPGVTDNAARLGLAYPALDLWIISRFADKKNYSANINLVAGDPDALAASADDLDSTLQDDIAAQQQKATNVQIAIIEKRNRLANWYWANPFFLRGSVTVWGRDKYRAGDKVRMAWLADPVSGELGVTFYVDSVTHSWQAGGRYACTLGLQRGHGSGFYEGLLERIRKDMPASNPLGFASVDL